MECKVSDRSEFVSGGCLGFCGLLCWSCWLYWRAFFLAFSWTVNGLLVLCCLHRAVVVASAWAVSGSSGSLIPLAHDPSLRLGCLWLACTTTRISQSTLMTASVVHAITTSDSARGGSLWGWAVCGSTKAQDTYPSQV